MPTRRRRSDEDRDARPRRDDAPQNDSHHARVLALQRAAGNHATTRLLQRLSATDVKAIQIGIAGMEVDYGSLKGSYPVIQAAENMARRSGMDMSAVTALLTMTVVAYRNASRFKNIIASIEETQREEALRKLFTQIDGTWATRSLLTAKRYPGYAAAPENLEFDLRHVLTYLRDQWPHLSPEGRAGLVDKLFNHAKGYDTILDDIGKIELEKLLGTGAAGGVQPADIGRGTADWLASTPNTNPFTGMSMPTGPKVTAIIAQQFAGADEEARKRLFAIGLLPQLIANEAFGLSWSDPGKLQEVMDAGINEIKAELTKIPGVGAALAQAAETLLADITSLW